MLDFSAYIDKFDLIVQKNTSGADGGDSAHRFGVTYACLKIAGSKVWVDGSDLDAYYNKAMSKYEVKPNTYARHPDPSKWYNNPLNFSRDQTTMLLKAMMAQGDTNRTWGLFKTLIRNYGRHFNFYPNYALPGDPEYVKKFPDILAPSEISDVLRSFQSPWLYPVLCVIDSFKFLDVYFAKLDDDKSKLKGGRTDYYTMLVMDVITSRYVQDTFVMRLVAKMLSKYDYKGAIKYIFRPDYDDPPLDSLMLPLAERYIDAS